MASELYILESDSINKVKKVLKEWLEKKDIKVLRWQIVPWIHPYSEPGHLFHGWKWGVNLIIEYQNKKKKK